MPLSMAVTFAHQGGIPSTQTGSSGAAWRVLQVDWRVWLVHRTRVDI